MTFSDEIILKLAQLPETAFKFKVHIDSLVAFYCFVREQWTATAIADLKSRHNLNLRSTEGKAKLAWYAAQEWVKCLPPSVTSYQSSVISEEVKPIEVATTEAKTVKVLCQAIALLNPVPETNGLEDAPAYAIMGNPIYLDELRRNYFKLASKWHPDRNPNNPEASDRFALISAIYKELDAQWLTKYSPLIPISKIGKDNVDRAFNKKFAFSPESFWQ